MGMPTWWGQRRYGLLVHASIATVPAWAPIGQRAEWYRSHLGDALPDTAPAPQPLVEVLAHHRDRWDFVERFDEFLPLLTFDDFDAESWARLAVDAGMGYGVFVAKHHDGLCWWDAPNTTRTTLRHGPGRNVLAEFAAACERNDVVFGTSYSLLDWSDERYPDPDYVDEVLHPHATDLVERYGTNLLWDDGSTAPRSAWRTTELLERLRKVHPALVVNDRWAAPDDVPPGGPPVVRSVEGDPPAGIVQEPWELYRGIGVSLGHNRAERAEHQLTGFDIVALLTEVVAKGGHLLLGVGPAADGTIPELQAAPLRDAGEWVRRHTGLVAEARPWTVWGDDDVRYLALGDSVHAVDIGGTGRFGGIDPEVHRVVAVHTSDGDTIDFEPLEDGVQLLLPRNATGRPLVGPAAGVDVGVYRLDVVEVDRPAALFAPEPPALTPLAPLLADAVPGDIVQLGDGTYLGPAEVPGGVVLRGLGPDRTRIENRVAEDAGDDGDAAGGDGDAAGGGGGPALRLGRGAHLEHVTVAAPAGPAGSAPAAVEVVGPAAGLLGCTVDGLVVVRADRVTLRASAIAGIVAHGVERLCVSRCRLVGDRVGLDDGTAVGIDLRGGADHEIDSCRITGHRCGVRAHETTGVVVRGNTISGRWWGVHLCRTERSHVHGNQIVSTMRAVDLDGGAGALVEGNAVADGDSGCVVQGGASSCHVSGNRWERCRIGLLAWDAVALHEQDNTSIDLHEPEHALQQG